MAAFTTAEAQEQLDAWKAASLAVASGQSYAIGGRTLTRVNAAWIQKQMNYWARVLAGLQRQAEGRSAHSTKLASFTK